MVAEAYIEKIARFLNKPVEHIREINLLKEGEVTHYGQAIECNQVRPCASEMLLLTNLEHCVTSGHFITTGNEHGWRFEPCTTVTCQTCHPLSRWPKTTTQFVTPML